MNAMDKTSGNANSLWVQTEKEPTFEPLSRDLACDVVVIGGGIAGLSCAYNLLRSKQTVIVLEDGQIASGETGRTSAHLSYALDDRFYELEKYHGEQGARLAAESHSAAIDWIEALCRSEKIECDFERVDGYLFVPPGQDLSVLEKEYAAARRAGLKMAWESKVPWGSYDTGKCLKFSRQAQFHPTKYMAGLAESIVRFGGQIFTHTHATTVTGGKGAFVETKNGHHIAAKHIVVATNVPINERVAIHTKQASYRSYVIAASIPAGTVPHALYWDTVDPYHYVRVTQGDSSLGEELLIIGGEDHKTGQPHSEGHPYDRLEAWARERFPQIKNIAYRWSGQVVEPSDGLAFIGRSPLDPSNVYLVTGDSGNGLTHGTIAGLLITDLITGRENPWANLYDPSRIKLSSAGDYVMENANTAAQYKDWVTPGDKDSVEQIACNSGAIVRHGFTKIAAYRDSHGALHTLSAVCPHLGAIVHWNAKEKTWDCPAHGSRFSPTGQVLNGPANVSLKAAHNKEKSSAGSK